jgi:hypothetical protein
MNRIIFLPICFELGGAGLVGSALPPNILYWGDEPRQANSTFAQIIFEHAKPLQIQPLV